MIKDFNYTHIYGHERLIPFKEYSSWLLIKFYGFEEYL